jgi:hypothetical protein
MRRILLGALGVLATASATVAQQQPATTLPPPSTFPLTPSLPSSDPATLNNVHPIEEDRTTPAQQRAQPALPGGTQEQRAEPAQPQR